MNLEIYKQITELPKGELHVHLNGLVPTEVIKSLLLSRESIVSLLPEGFDLDNDLNVSSPKDSLSSYLKPWQAFRFIPTNRQGLYLMLEASFKSLYKDNVKFVEIRSTIIYIAQSCKVDVSYVLEWMIEGINHFSQIYKVKAGLILTVSRGESSYSHLSALLKAYRDLRFPKIVVGLDLAGDEDVNYSPGLEKKFKKAKDDYNLKITIHAGETGNVANISTAIDKFGADRIGHGTALFKDPSLIEKIIDRNICFEVCPVSNILSGVLNEYSYSPIKEFINNGIPFVLCSDNPGIHKTALSDDYYYLYSLINDFKVIENMYENQIKYTFLAQ